LREYNFTVTSEPIKDCGDPSRLVIYVNGMHPPPAIEAMIGDVVRVNLLNMMSNKDNFTLHFHEIRQRGTPRSDGVLGVTQYPTPVNESYTYEFVACRDQAGTYL